MTVECILTLSTAWMSSASWCVNAVCEHSVWAQAAVHSATISRVGLLSAFHCGHTRSSMPETLPSSGPTHVPLLPHPPLLPWANAGGAGRTRAFSRSSLPLSGRAAVSGRRITLGPSAGGRRGNRREKAKRMQVANLNLNSHRKAHPESREGAEEDFTGSESGSEAALTSSKRVPQSWRGGQRS